jgi:hypothetical protein
VNNSKLKSQLLQGKTSFSIFTLKKSIKGETTGVRLQLTAFLKGTSRRWRADRLKLPGKSIAAASGRCPSRLTAHRRGAAGL